MWTLMRYDIMTLTPECCFTHGLTLQCRDNPCRGGQCINRPGHFECRCDRGFLLDSATNTCVDQDECEVDNGGCDQVCANTEGARLCRSEI